MGSSCLKLELIMNYGFKMFELYIFVVRILFKSLSMLSLMEDHVKIPLVSDGQVP